jgi:transcriptional regulator with XRE-family HTH domain
MTTKTNKTPKEVRLALGVSQLRVAADANVSEPSVRVYEASRLSVTPPIRARLDPIYRALAQKAGLSIVGDEAT